MGAVPVHYQDELAPNISMQQDDKLHHLFKVDVAAMNLKVETQVMPHRRYGDPGNHRETIVTIPTVLERCFPFGRPVAAHNRLEHVATLVDQDDRLAILTGLFSTYPILLCTRWRSLLRLAHAPPSLWLLDASAHPPEDVPDMTGVIPHPKFTPNHLGYALQRPQIGRKTGRFCSLQQNGFQFPLLFGCQSGLAPCMRFGTQRLRLAFFQRFLPPTYRRGSNADQATYFSHTFALLDQPCPNLAAHFQYLCTTFWSHSTNYIGCCVL